jgi:hypothetical protein
MNRTKLKNYAPQARRDFIQAMTDRAAFYGLTAKIVEPVVERGDVAVIAGREHPRAVAKKRKQLEDRIKRHGFEQTMEAMAYTWFNRLVAIRFMELHGYLDHGYRVLSAAKLTTDNTDGTDKKSNPSSSVKSVLSVVGIPEILLHAEHVDLPGLKKEAVIDLKLAGNKEAELYRLLLTAQCNALNTAMPFLFEKIDDETELLLPDNLLHSDSLIRKLVGEIDEEDWKAVEIIGWLYQFYISEKKDEVIGKVVASEDIPAATQLFTPNWIVKYLVQNTLGRQWLATYPQSALRKQMEYYIEPAKQTPEVLEQLKAITPTSLNPEELTLLDPACGSGHILVEAYDLFKAIYQERGYRAKDIPALILQKNLFGLEIDDRAAQLAAFALMMKARADDRRIFDSEAQPNILAFQDSQGMNAGDITHALNSPILKEEMPPSQYLMEEIEEDDNPLFNRKTLSEKGHVALGDVASLVELFENAKTFGSLIQMPAMLVAKLPEIQKRLNDVLKFGDLTHASAHVIKPLLQQARLLARQYDAVLANPPYMGAKYYAGKLKEFVADQYKEAKADLYASFMKRNRRFVKASGFHGMINIPNWMFLSSFEELRKGLFNSQTIDTFVHNGRGVFGSDFGSCVFAIRNAHLPEYRGTYKRLFDKQGSVASNEELKQRFHTAKPYSPSNADFAKIPGSPVAYWVSDAIRTAFQTYPTLAEIAPIKIGMRTGDNNRFLRRWHEIAWDTLGIGCADSTEAIKTGCKWFPFNKGGEYRKWFGNAEFIVNWEDNGAEVKADTRLKYPELGDNLGWKITNEECYFRKCITWSAVSTSCFGVRYLDKGSIFGTGGSCAFPNTENFDAVAAFLCSNASPILLRTINPTLNINLEDVQSLPFQISGTAKQAAEVIAQECLSIARSDWNSSETSWDFASLPVLQHKVATLRESQQAADVEYQGRFTRMKQLEEKRA